MNSPPEPLRAHANLFERLDYLVKTATFLNAEALNERHQLEAIMATNAELQAALDANTAATAAVGTAISTEITQLASAIAALSTTDAPTQAQIDQLNASATALQAATVTLGADDPAPPAA